MAVTQEKILHLRTLINGLEGACKKKSFASTTVPIPKGVLVEVTGNRKTEWIIEFLKENKDAKVFWLEKQQTIFPTGLHQRGVDLKRIVFGMTDSFFEASRKAIQSQSFQVVILPSLIKEDRYLKNLQLLAEKTGTTVFLMANAHQVAWPIGVQIEVNHEYNEFQSLDTHHKIAEDTHHKIAHPWEIKILKHKYLGFL